MARASEENYRIIVEGNRIAVFDLYAILPHEGPSLRFVERDILYNYETEEAIGRKMMTAESFDFRGHVKGTYPGHCMYEGFNLVSGGLGIILHPLMDAGAFA